MRIIPKNLILSTSIFLGPLLQSHAIVSIDCDIEPKDSVCHIKSKTEANGKRYTGDGTGTLVGSQRKYVLTSKHVTEGASQISVSFGAGYIPVKRVISSTEIIGEELTSWEKFIQNTKLCVQSAWDNGSLWSALSTLNKSHHLGDFALLEMSEPVAHISPAPIRGFCSTSSEEVTGRFAQYGYGYGITIKATSSGKLKQYNILNRHFSVQRGARSETTVTFEQICMKGTFDPNISHTQLINVTSSNKFAMPGDSGGGLFDENGQLIALCCASNGGYTEELGIRLNLQGVMALNSLETNDYKELLSGEEKRFLNTDPEQISQEVVEKMRTENGFSNNYLAFTDQTVAKINMIVNKPS